MNAIFSDPEPAPSTRYYAIALVSNSGISCVRVRGLESACQMYAVLLDDPRFIEHGKQTRPSRYVERNGTVNWGENVKLTAKERAAFKAVKGGDRRWPPTTVEKLRRKIELDR
jgi:hypothetical protein